MSFESLFDSLVWWSSPAREGRDAFRDECGRRYLSDWLGRRCDGQVDEAISAMALWQVTRILCSQPEEFIEQRTQLREVLERAQTHRSESILTYVLLAMREFTDDASRKPQQVLLEAQLHTARAALLLTETDATDEEVVSALSDAARCFALANMPDGAVPSHWPKVEVSAGSLSEASDNRFLRLFAALHRSCRGLQSDSSLSPMAVRKALCELERGVSWLLGFNQTGSESRYLVIPFVVTEMNRRKLHRRESEVPSSPEGSLAVLRMTRFHSQVVFAEESATPVLVADPVCRGLLIFSDDWNQHFEQALTWATSQHTGSAGVLMYRIDFLFPALVRDSGNPELLRRFERPVRVAGGSASLAAGLLARATLENRQIACGACITGVLTESANGSTELGRIRGLIPKLQVFQDVLQKQLKNSLWLAGPAEQEDEQALAVLQQLPGFPAIHRITEPQSAYDRLTGETDLIRRYAASELNWIWSRIERFCPKRLQQQLSVGLRADDFDFSHLAVLDELTMTQSVIEERAPSPKKNASAKQEDDGPKAIALDQLLDRYVTERHVPCVKLLGGPGMGKTWAGLRWHLKLIADYWRHMTGASDKPLTSACLPIWVTVKELQVALLKNDKGSLNDVLIDLVTGRTADELSIHVNKSRSFAGQPQRESASDPSLRFRQLLSRHITSGEVFLIVDAWDERDRTEDAEQLVRKRLGHWVGRGRPLLMTSRQVGEYSRSGDPLDFMSREVPPWTIQAGNSTADLRQFMRQWFGSEYRHCQDAVKRLEQNKGLNELCRVPQLAAFTCLLIEVGKFPEGRVRSGPLLQAVVQEVLAKYATSTREPLDRHWVNAINSGRFLNCLQLLAYRTFDASRWVLTQDLLFEELTDPTDTGLVSPNYRTIVKGFPVTADDIAQHITNCGLFDVSDNGNLQIVNQTIAEVLVAGRLLIEQPEFPDDLDDDNAIDLALRRGLLDPKWRNTWKYYASLHSAANSLIRFLITICRKDDLHPIPRNSATESYELLIVCTGEAVLLPNDEMISAFSNKISLTLISTERSHFRAFNHFSTRRIGSRDEDDRGLIDLWSSCVNLARSEYYGQFAGLYWSVSTDRNGEAISDDAQIAAAVLFAAERIELRQYWDVFKRSDIDPMPLQWRSGLRALIHYVSSSHEESLIQLASEEINTAECFINLTLYAFLLRASEGGGFDARVTLAKSVLSFDHECDRLLAVVVTCITLLIPEALASSRTAELIKLVDVIGERLSSGLEQTPSRLRPTRLFSPPSPPQPNQSLRQKLPSLSDVELSKTLVSLLEAIELLQIPERPWAIQLASFHQDLDRNIKQRDHENSRLHAPLRGIEELHGVEEVDDDIFCPFDRSHQSIVCREPESMLRLTARLAIRSLAEAVYSEVKNSDSWPEAEHSNNRTFPDIAGLVGGEYEERWARYCESHGSISPIANDLAEWHTCFLDTPEQVCCILNALTWLMQQQTPWSWPGCTPFSDSGEARLEPLMSKHRVILINRSAAAVHSCSTLFKSSNSAPQIYFFSFSSLDDDEALVSLSKRAKKWQILDFCPRERLHEWLGCEVFVPEETRVLRKV